MKSSHTWNKEELLALYQQPLMELLYRAASVHRQHHNPNKVQVSSLISIKTGGCPEDCAYCPQAARYHTEVSAHGLLPVEEVRRRAEQAKAAGASRICMGAAWRNVKDGPEFDQVLQMVRMLNKMDVEVCCTLGMITLNQARRLSEAGLYAYNHNLDSSAEYYEKIISTRAYQDRLETIENVRETNIRVCSGGIIGMGEALSDRIEMLLTLAALKAAPESVPINALVPVEGTPLARAGSLPAWEMIRMVAVARIVLPHSQIRLSAGRQQMNPQAQALCFLAGANSIFSGEKLLTTPNPQRSEDEALFDALGLVPQLPFEKGRQPETVEACDSRLQDLGEKPRWSRPGSRLEK